MKFQPFLLSLLIAAAPAGAATISDNFNTGSDASWTRYSPLAGFGAPGTFSFPGGNTYRIAAAASPSPASLGPGRAGSFQTTTTYTDFDMNVDVVDYDSSQSSMVVGLLARTTTIGLGTTNGYGLTLGGGAFAIQVITGELPGVTVATAPLTLSPVTQYRVFFHGLGTTLSAELYDLTNLSTPLATISGSNATYTSGVNGLFVYANSTTAGATARATYDNYFTATPVPEPATTGLAGLGLMLLLPRRRK